MQAVCFDFYHSSEKILRLNKSEQLFRLTKATETQRNTEIKTSVLIRASVAIQ